MKFHINGRFLTQNLTGVQRFAYELTSNIIKRNGNVTVITPNSNLIPYDIETERIIKTGNFKSHLWEQTDLRFFSVRQKGSLLINLGNTAPMYFRKQVITIHDLSVFTNPKWFSKTFSTVYKTLLPNIAKYSEKIITVSEFSKSEIVRHLQVSPSKIEVIYNAVSPEIKPDLNVINPKNSYGQYILAVSSIDPRKNLPRLIEAFQNLKNKDLNLVIVGASNSIFNQSVVRPTDSEQIIFTNRVSNSELASLYMNAVCLVFPSLYEGFGLPPIEAMKMGCPVITSNNSSLPEICGDAAYYINPTSTQEITAAINEMLTDEKLRNDLKMKGEKRSAFFNWSESSLKLLTIIEKS